MIFKISKEVAQRADYFKVFSYLEDSLLKTFVSFVINSNFRKAVALTPWLDNQVDNVSQSTVELVRSIVGLKDDDDTKAIKITRWVQQHITYKQDIFQWKMTEYWQTADETLKLEAGDCDDGNGLIYVLCRTAGIPADRLLCFCGDTEVGGHFWVGYRPIQYPLNWAFLDFCFYPSSNAIRNRDLFYIADKKIYAYTPSDDEYHQVNSKYNSIWFGFSEKTSLLSIQRKVN
jgi:transglutaminase-like putative cysteine protease